MIETIVTVLGGGVLGVLLTFVLNSRKQTTSEFQVLLDEREKDNERLRREVEQYKQKMDELIKEFNELQEKFIYLEAANTNALPKWMFELHQIYIGVSISNRNAFVVDLQQVARAYRKKPSI